MQYQHVFVGTYHKTGTVWMGRVFGEIANKLGLSISDRPLLSPNVDVNEQIILENHCQLPDRVRASNFRGFRIIRDPRDVVISGMHYHLRSSEDWLLETHDRFGGRSYQQKLLDIEDVGDRYRFEMQEAGAATIQEMLNGADLPLKTIRYESLMKDTDHSTFGDIAVYLGFSSDEMEDVLAAYRKFSFHSGGNVEKDEHGRSGKVAQWRKVYSRSLATDFVAKHGDALLALGYEINHDWVEECPVSQVA